MQTRRGHMDRASSKEVACRSTMIPLPFGTAAEFQTDFVGPVVARAQCPKARQGAKLAQLNENSTIRH